MKKQEIEMFNLANAYKNSYNIISDFANVKFPIQGRIDQAKLLCNIPAATLAAFSCELFMKSMLYAEDTSVIRLHDLSELFKKLQSEAQRQIRENTCSKYDALSNKQIDFYKELDVCANLFITSRYCYEHGVRVNMIFVRCFLQALFEYANTVIG